MTHPKLIIDDLSNARLGFLYRSSWSIVSIVLELCIFIKYYDWNHVLRYRTSSRNIFPHDFRCLSGTCSQLDAIPAKKKSFHLQQKKFGLSIKQLSQISRYPRSLLSDRVARDTTALREPFDPESSTIVLKWVAKQYSTRIGVVRCLP
jgi:hypothetical protein